MNQITVGVSEQPADAEMGQSSKLSAGEWKIQMTFGVTEWSASAEDGTVLQTAGRRVGGGHGQPS